MVTVRINDEERQFERPLSAAELLERLGKDPAKLALEINRVVIPRSEQPRTILQSGDTIEIVTLVGGG